MLDIIQSICISLVIIFALFALGWSPNVKADNVQCYGGNFTYTYHNVHRLQPVDNRGPVYQFYYNNKRYLVSLTRCVIEFDK